MAIHYNLAKVYAISDDDKDFVLQIVKLFVEEVPLDVKQIKEGINAKDYAHAYGYAHKINPTLSLLGMEAAHDEILQIEQWAKNKGKKKEIKEIYKSMSGRIDLALSEIKKNYSLHKV
ncbi:histidine kinase [Flavobacterium psychrophilum]|uniref:Hpt domain-containing protein n=1 Tax=Flavobacterium psychrophilum TaxID=96345 RepID=UPI0004F68F71|nr:Hpt domain-containing protein [Flavobacterium psychrophilum]AIN73713.1 histidine kinase [Flavobacterium psychrophilum FPG3]EKT2072019.1 histidine kinase [Flavobacterium psychrophilum]EKT3965619.1 histidine kinase [Flavobacterium psychrophilum]EKT4491541.1 histidine kinase [Flavobacterium psychrophilum]EKT4499437.1 histidine kinase [Flavobacterium psychrophilum]